MVYNPLGKYTVTDLRWLTPEELQILFEDARKAILEVRGSRCIKKVGGDISRMRRMLNGFDSIYNGAHR